MSNQKPNQPMGDSNPLILQKLKEVTAKRAQGDFDNSLPYVDTFIPKNILIHCPMDKRTQHRAMNCRKCLHFGGTVQTAYDDERELPWDVKFAISCAYPLERKCTSFFETDT